MQNQISNNWQKVKLGEVLRIRRGASPRPIHEFIRDSGMPWLKIADVTSSSSRFVDSTKEFIKQEGIARSVVVNPGDLVLSNSATPGIPKFMRITACVHDGWLLLNPVDNLINKDFLYYRLLIDRHKLISNVTGAIFDNLKTEILREHEIVLPLPNEQKEIASILSAFDDKIELNNKIAKNLEETVQLIFKEWFIKSEKFKVESEKLSKLVKTQYGYTESANEKEIGPKFLRVMDINKTDFINWNSVPYCKISDNEFTKYKLKRGDIVIARMADPGKVAIIENDIKAVFASYLIRLQIVSDAITPYFLFYYLRSPLYQDFIFGASTGTTRQSANARVITDVELILPQREKMLEFESMASSIRIKTSAIGKENQKLATLRDLLLPKLMNGEIKI